MMSIKKVTADDPTVVSLATALSADPKDVARMLNAEAYRRAYNSQPKVKAERKKYNVKRNAEIRVIRDMVKADPELRAKILGKS